MRLLTPAIAALVTIGLAGAWLAFPATGQASLGAIGSRIGLGTCMADHRNVAMTALGRYDIAFAAGDLDLVDTLSASAHRAVEASLACSPVSADLWIDSARLHVLADGLSQQVFAELAMSCRISQFQYWNAEARLLSFEAVAHALPNDLQDCLARDRALLDSMTAADEI